MPRLGLGLGLGPIKPAGGGAAEPTQFITNGSFDADASWTKGAGWSIAAGIASCDGQLGGLSQDFGALVAPLVNGVSYTLTFDLVNDNAGTVRATLTGGTGSQLVYSAATAGAGRTATFTATDARTTIAFTSFSGEPISVDNVSLVAA